VIRKHSIKRNSRQRAFTPYVPPAPETIEFSGITFEVKKSKDFIRGIGWFHSIEARMVGDRFIQYWSGHGETEDEAMSTLRLKIQHQFE
jgi:hypothetical protein